MRAAALALVAILLLCAAAPALAEPQTQVEQVAQEQGQAQAGGQAVPATKIGGIADKLAALGGDVMGLVIVIAGLALIFGATKVGGRLLVGVIAGGLLLFGGWRFIIGLLRYLLQ